MSKKKKIIIVVSSLLVVILFLAAAYVNGRIKIEANKPKCVDAATEQQVRYILNMPTEDIGVYLYVDQVWNVTKAFGEPRSVGPNEDGLYTLNDGSNNIVDPPTEEYMNEEFLEFSLWLYTYKTGEILAIEEIEKLVTEGNIEKKAEIDAYYDWYYHGGGGNYIEVYASKYDNSGNIGGWTALTPEQQQQFVLDEEEREKQEELENSTNE